MIENKTWENWYILQSDKTFRSPIGHIEHEHPLRAIRFDSERSASESCFKKGDRVVKILLKIDSISEPLDIKELEKFEEKERDLEMIEKLKKKHHVK